MKTIKVVAIFEANIPEDMETSKIPALAERRIREKCEDFRIMVDSYLDIDEEQAEPYFELNDVMTGESVMIAIGSPFDTPR